MAWEVQRDWVSVPPGLEDRPAQSFPARMAVPHEREGTAGSASSFPGAALLWA